MNNFLKEWCNNHNAIKRTIDNLWTCLETYKAEDFKEFHSVFGEDYRNVKLYLDKMSYELNIPNFNGDLISVCIDIFQNERNVGYFKQLYHVNGDEYDDQFVIY